MKNLRGHKKSENDNIERLKEYGFDEKKINDYSSMSEEKLIDELILSVQKAKQNGTFDAQKIMTFVNIVAPKLDEKGRAKLNKLLEKIT